MGRANILKDPGRTNVSAIGNNSERVIIKMWKVCQQLYSNGLVRILGTFLVSFILGLVTGVRTLNTLTNHVNGNTIEITQLQEWNERLGNKLDDHILEEVISNTSLSANQKAILEDLRILKERL
jgi:hypothetical protein